jgi:hypothetical protein
MQPSFVDLKVNQKPDNISAYEWSRQKTAEFVREKKLAVLRLLAATEQEFERIKTNKEPLCKNQITQNEVTYRGQLLPDHINNRIITVISDQFIQRELGITNVTIQNNIVVAEREGGARKANKIFMQRPLFAYSYRSIRWI